MKKKLLRLSIITVTAAFLGSCLGGGEKISEVDLIPVSNGDEYQYIDREGKIIINPQFSEATVFRNGLALVKTSGDSNDRAWGYIDETGKYTINATYHDATVFSEEIAWVVAKNQAPIAINTKGETIFELKEAERVKIFKEGLAAFMIEEEDGETKWGFVDTSGNIKINPQFKFVKNFNNGKCAFLNGDDQWGYIDREGRIIINAQFDGVADFTDDKAVVNVDGEYGIIDETGKYLVNPQFDKAIADGKNYMINEGGKWGWSDSEGQIFINPQFDYAHPFNGNDYAPVESGGEWGFVDINGKYAINPQFDAALPFNGDLSLVGNAKKFGFIDREGKYVVNPQFKSPSMDYYNYIVLGSSKYEYVNSDFVDIDAINAAISLESPEGLTFEYTFGQIAHEMDKTFRSNDYNYEIVEDKKINKRFSYSLYVDGEPFKEERVQRGSGYYSYWDTEIVFDRDAKPSSFIYYFSADPELMMDVLRKRIISEGCKKVVNVNGRETHANGEDGEIEVYEGKGKKIELNIIEGGTTQLKILPS